MKRRTFITPAIRSHRITTPALPSRRISLPVPERRRSRRGPAALLGIGALIALLVAVPAGIRAAASWVARGIRVDSLDSR